MKNKREVDFINNNTREVVKDLWVTQKEEFIDIRGDIINEGVPYHIHHTYDSETYYMTGEEHEISSILIFKLEDNSILSKYKRLVGKQRQIYLNETRSTPGELDYEQGFFIMYFARQSNDRNAKIFEITKEDYKLETPFYIKIGLKLLITGERERVERSNMFNIVNLGLIDIVSPLQFYRQGKNTRESVQDRLTTYQQVSSGTSTTTTSGGGSGGY